MTYDKIIVHGMMTSKNFGDVLLGQTTIGWLRELGCSEVLTAYASPEVQKILGTRNARPADYASADAVILSGGGYFQMMDRGRPALKRFVKNTGPLMAGGALGKPLAILAVGMAPLPHAILRQGVRRLFNRARLVTLRDPRSMECAGELSLRKPPVLAGDLVFAHRPETLPPALLDEARGIVGKGRVLALHLSDSSAGSPDYARLHKLIEQELAPLTDTRFLLIADHPSGDSGGPQARAQAELQRRLGPDRCILAPYRDTAFLMALLSVSDAVLTNKLHVGLAAAAMGTMPFSLAKNVKNLGSFADLGLAGTCAMLDAPDEDIRPILHALRDCETGFEVPEAIRARSMSNRDLLAGFLAGKRAA